ncbi:concanavalin A-like lectin/glucanase [Exidia glandulosa HHB12029]|uniref:Concanavalin A-like lectin/glucanase n=1 Tax=Exidia glandulosa HHB12029 TaxID=1314781 RepID=A0A166B6T7_EXIGL|nr:concanavalin A-like lectin/glucanase [Exidia glandulosa HHB12029]
MLRTWKSQCVPGAAAPTSTATAVPTSTASTTAPAATCSTVDTANHCGQWDTVNTGPYTMYLDQWGISGATGSDCAQIQSLCGTTIKWTTTWSWSGGSSGVKTYTNINANTGLNKQLSAIKSIPSTWTWSQTSTGTIVANIAYDLFTSSTAGGSNQYEIMIWLANYGAGPISYNYDSSGNPVPVATSVSLAGKTWNLYYGSNGSNYVYSFLPTSGTVTNFSGDINLFLKYLTANQTLAASQYLVTAQSGTEATTGKATLTFGLQRTASL